MPPSVLKSDRECRHDESSQVHELVDQVRLVEVGGQRAQLLVRRYVPAGRGLAQLALLLWAFVSRVPIQSNPLNGSPENGSIWLFV